jgi:hypothetical protein
MEDRMQKGADKWRTELFKPRLELWEGEQMAHYPGNHYVDSRLLDTGR